MRTKVILFMTLVLSLIFFFYLCGHIGGTLKEEK